MACDTLTRTRNNFHLDAYINLIQIFEQRLRHLPKCYNEVNCVNDIVSL